MFFSLVFCQLPVKLIDIRTATFLRKFTSNESAMCQMLIETARVELEKKFITLILQFQKRNWKLWTKVHVAWAYVCVCSLCKDEYMWKSGSRFFATLLCSLVRLLYVRCFWHCSDVTCSAGHRTVFGKVVQFVYVHSGASFSISYTDAVISFFLIYSNLNLFRIVFMPVNCTSDVFVRMPGWSWTRDPIII